LASRRTAVGDIIWGILASRFVMIGSMQTVSGTGFTVKVKNTWYQYKGDCYYPGADGAMVKGLQASGDKWY